MVVEQALAQIPAEHIETIEILVRADTAGATHDLLGFRREHRLRYTVGYELSDPVRDAILKIPENALIAALGGGGECQWCLKQQADYNRVTPARGKEVSAGKVSHA